MKKTIILAAATMLVTGTGAFAQAAMSPAPGTTNSATTTKNSSATAKSAMPDAGMKADASADAAAKPKAHHRRMAKNEAALNAKEAETTKQLNQEQAQMASNRSGSMSSGNASGMDSNAASGMNGPSAMTNDPNRPNSGMGRVQGANSGVEGRVGGTNSGNPGEPSP